MKACTLPTRIHVLFLGLLVLWGNPLHAQIWPFGKSKKGSDATSARSVANQKLVAQREAISRT